jgi:hypothetical protein
MIGRSPGVAEPERKGGPRHVDLIVGVEVDVEPLQERLEAADVPA